MVMPSDEFQPNLTAQQLGKIKEDVEQAQFARGDPQLNCQTELAALHNSLVEVSKRYSRGNLPEQRECVIDALLAVHYFLDKQGFRPLTRDALMRPIRALVEIDDNRIDPLFTERVRDGTPSRTFTADYRSAVLACLANLWLVVEEGKEGTYKQKLGRAARKLKGSWFGTVTRAHLDSARKLVSQSAKSDRIGKLAREFFETLKVYEDFGAERAFNLAIRRQNDLAPFDLTWGTNLKTPPVSSDEQE